MTQPLPRRHNTTPSLGPDRHAEPSLTHCPDPGCGATLATHIGGKPCVVGTPSTATALHDLPIFGRMWRSDGRTRNA